MLFGPRQRSVFDGSSKEDRLSPRSEGAVNSTTARGESNGRGSKIWMPDFSNKKTLRS